MFTTITRKKIFEEIKDQILEQILQNQLKPGDKLPSERKLSEIMHVSRPSVREALRTLENQGYLETKVGGGTYVREIALQNIITPISLLLKQNTNMLNDIIETRSIIEISIARLAAERIKEENVIELQEIIKQMEEKAKQNISVFEEDTKFHLAIAKATGNHSLYTLLHMCRELINYTIEAVLSKPNEPMAVLNEHKKIFESLVNKNPDAAETYMREHLMRIEERIFK